MGNKMTADNGELSTPVNEFTLDFHSEQHLMTQCYRLSFSYLIGGQFWMFSRHKSPTTKPSLIKKYVTLREQDVLFQDAQITCRDKWIATALMEELVYHMLFCFKGTVFKKRKGSMTLLHITHCIITSRWVVWLFHYHGIFYSTNLAWLPVLSLKPLQHPSDCWVFPWLLISLWAQVGMCLFMSAMTYQSNLRFHWGQVVLLNSRKLNALMEYLSN